MTRKTTIAIVDDHQLVAQGIGKIFESDQEHEVIAIYHDSQEAFEKLLVLKPDILLTDLDMPGWNGLELIEKLRAKGAQCKTILLTMHMSQAVVKKVLEMKLDGYLPKNADESEFRLCIDQVSAGKTYYSQKAMEVLISNTNEINNDGLKKTQNLTNRELEILKLIANGLSTREISEQLFIALRTVETHRKAILEKLGVHNVAGMVRIAVQEGLLD